MANMEQVLSLENVSLLISGKEILRDINWSVDAQSHQAIVGKNGAGKSFLLRVICGDIFPTTGRVMLLGKRLGEYDIWQLKTRIGVVSDLLQRDYHSGSSVENTIASGFHSSNGLYDKITPRMSEKIGELMEFFGISSLSGRRFGTLSHGEQRRTLVARALASEPQLLILDEPCTGLDITAREEFLQAVGRLAREKAATILFVTHHLEEIIPEIKNVMFMKNGTVLDHGNKEKLFTEKKLREVFDHPVNLFERNGRYYLH